MKINIFKSKPMHNRNQHGAERQQAINHCWPSSLLAHDATRPQYSVTMPQCLNATFPVPTITQLWLDPKREICSTSWWRHQMETFSALVDLCARNSPVTGEFPSQKTVTRIFVVFFDLRLTKVALNDVTVIWWLCSLIIISTVVQSWSKSVNYSQVHCFIWNN